MTPKLARLNLNRSANIIKNKWNFILPTKETARDCVYLQDP